MEKSIEERAKELGVPVIQPVKRDIFFPTQPDDKQDFDKYLSQSIEAICGGCGKEIYHSTLKSPCGRQDCPFGYLHYSNATI